MRTRSAALPAALPDALRRGSSAVGVALLLALIATPASAQLGKLKKMGADAAKAAAKDKLGGKDSVPAGKPSAATEAAKATAGNTNTAPLDATLTAERVDMVLAALAPLAAAAETASRDRAIERAYLTRDSTSKACMKAAEGRMPTAPGASAQKQIMVLQKDGERLNERFSAALLARTPDAPFLEDSLTVTMNRSAVLSLGLKCQFEYAPRSLLLRKSAQVGKVVEDGAPSARTTIPPGARGNLSKAQFARMRERIALYGLSAAEPGVKTGAEGVFSAEEQAVLSARAAQIGKLTPFFKNGTMSWGGGGDLANW